MSNIVSKVKTGVKKSFEWTVNHLPEICAVTIGTITVAAPFIAAYQYMKQPINPGDIVRYSPSSGWLLIDSDNPQIYWPIDHGLTDEEVKSLSELINDGLSTGQALIKLGLLRANC